MVLSGIIAATIELSADHLYVIVRVWSYPRRHLHLTLFWFGPDFSAVVVKKRMKERKKTQLNIPIHATLLASSIYHRLLSPKIQIRPATTSYANEEEALESLI